MPAKIIDGKAVAASIRAECRERVQRIVATGGTPPGLAVIVVGTNPASQVYVRNKIKACADVGIRSFRYDYPADVNPQSVVDKIEELNQSGQVHGILVQLPLPPTFDISRILHTISVEKDVDGFHLYNVGDSYRAVRYFRPARPTAF